MFRLLVALTVISCSFAATIQDATQTAEFQEWSGKIVGGSTATPGQFPHQASLRSTAGAHFCGGTILNSRWVLSAAHCTVNRTPGTTIVVVGAHFRTTGGTTMQVERIANHPNYSSWTLAFDISLLRTAAEIIQSSTVGFLPLGSDFIATAPGALTSGWGQTSHPGSAANELQFLRVDVITNEECRSRLSATNAARIGDSTVCVSSPSGQGLCMGDSGGPLEVRGYVVGAVSWGVPCGTAAPDMYGRVSAALSWLNEIMAS